MCEIITKKKNILGTNKYEVYTSCKKTGKPITVANKWGMFCEEMCDLEACKKVAEDLKDLFRGLGLEGIRK